jgi:hypothetical protein
MVPTIEAATGTSLPASESTIYAGKNRQYFGRFTEPFLEDNLGPFASNRSGKNAMDGTEDLMQINISHFFSRTTRICLPS